jgi:hypothetical protein
MKYICVGAILGGGAFVLWLFFRECVRDYRAVMYGVKGRDW